MENQAEVGRQPTTDSGRREKQCMSFTREDIKIVECYYQSDPNKRGYMARIIKIWKERRGFELTENGLAMQARTIIRKRWLTAEGLAEIRIGETDQLEQLEGQDDSIAIELTEAAALTRLHSNCRRESQELFVENNIRDLNDLPEEKRKLVEDIKTQR